MHWLYDHDKSFRYPYDNNLAALCGIHQEWTRLDADGQGDGEDTEDAIARAVIIRDNYFAYKGDSIAPAMWNFVYENKNPNVDIGVHKNENGKLPELFENVDGEVA